MGRKYFVTANGRHSFIKISELGKVQGSILAPFLYAIFVSPLFDLAPFFAFADDMQVILNVLNKIGLMCSVLQELCPVYKKMIN